MKKSTNKFKLPIENKFLGMKEQFSPYKEKPTKKGTRNSNTKSNGKKGK